MTLLVHGINAMTSESRLCMKHAESNYLLAKHVQQTETDYFLLIDCKNMS